MSSDQVMGRTVWAEARGCGYAGISHVASVIINRCHNPRWWGHDIISVCQAPWQFSCWNANDPNRAKLLAVDESDSIFKQALYISQQAILGNLPDVTCGADSYYARSMLVPPAWAATCPQVFADDWHLFYRTELPAPTGTHPIVPNVGANAKAVIQPTELTAEELNALYNPQIQFT